jgi:hypothetical protein
LSLARLTNFKGESVKNKQNLKMASKDLLIHRMVRAAPSSSLFKVTQSPFPCPCHESKTLFFSSPFKPFFPFKGCPFFIFFVVRRPKAKNESKKVPRQGLLHVFIAPTFVFGLRNCPRPNTLFVVLQMFIGNAETQNIFCKKKLTNGKKAKLIAINNLFIVIIPSLSSQLIFQNSKYPRPQ